MKAGAAAPAFVFGAKQDVRPVKTAVSGEQSRKTQRYSIRYEPNAVCWSQAPSNMKDLMKQRRLWHLGLSQSMTSYPQIFANPRFGLVSWVSYMYYLLFELLSPAIEVFGILTVGLAACFVF